MPRSSQKSQGVGDRLVHRGVVEVEVGLVAVEAVPEVLPAHRVPGPVRRLGVDEDDPCVLVELVGVGPHVEVAVRPVGVAARGLEPRVLVGRVVHDEVDDHPDATLVRRVEEPAEVADVADVVGDVGEVRDVVAAVAQRGREERRQPQAVDAEPLDVVQLLGQPGEVADAVGAGVLERPDQHLVEDGPLEPAGIGLERHLSGSCARAGRAPARGPGRAVRSRARPSARPRR